jgi:hypothetical protein
MSSVTPETGPELLRKKLWIFQPSALTSRAITSCTSPSIPEVYMASSRLNSCTGTSDGLVNLGFDVISVEQMSSTRQSSAEGTTTVNIPLFLITLPRTSKSHEIFILMSLCYIAIRVEAYKAQTSLTQCLSGQQFGHVWANCKQPPCCMWGGGGHLHKECLEKGNTALIPTCWNCKLVDREKPHLSNYQGCRHTKEEMRRRKPQRVPKTTKGRVLSSSHTIPGLSFVVVLRSNTQQQQQPQPHSAAQACPDTVGEMSAPSLEAQPTTSTKSVQAPNANSSSLNVRS